MKTLKLTLFGVCTMVLSACCQNQASCGQECQCPNDKNQVIETIMARRSVRQYEDRAVNRDTMQIILDCGINAPNGMNKQQWEIRVVDNPDFINGLTELFKEANPEMAQGEDFKNMFRNAPTVVFIANEKGAPMTEINCGLLGENMILSAWSMGIGSCCLGGPIFFMKSNEVAQEYVEKLGFSEGYELLYAIAFGYPAEQPEAKPRDASKIQFVE